VTSVVILVSRDCIAFHYSHAWEPLFPRKDNTVQLDALDGPYPFLIRRKHLQDFGANFGAFAGSLCGSRMNCHTVSEQACAAQGCPRRPVTDQYVKTWPCCPIPHCRSPPIRSPSYRVRHKTCGSTRTNHVRE
jgi:hypothetical protein